MKLKEILESKLGWPSECRLVDEWCRVPKFNGRGDYSEFDPSNLAGSLARTTLLDMSDPMDPIVRVRGEELNSMTVGLRRGDRLRDVANPATWKIFRGAIAAVDQHPCIALYPIEYWINGVCSIKGRSLLFPYQKGQDRLVMACTKVDALDPQARDASSSVSVAIDLPLYLDYGYGAPSASAAGSVLCVTEEV